MHVGRIARYPVCNPDADVAGILPNPLSVPTVPARHCRDTRGHGRVYGNDCWIDLDACRDIRRGIHGGVRHMGILMMGI